MEAGTPPEALPVWVEGDGADRFHLRRVEPRGAGGLAFVLVHGGGHTGASWQAVGAALGRAGYRSFSPDLRGHGLTRCEDERDLSLERLLHDLELVVRRAVPADAPLVLAGHSLGGALVVRLARLPSLCARVRGVVVVDVVEGTALASVDRMVEAIQKVPGRFRSEADAVSWATSSGELQSEQSAWVSIPPRLVRDESGQCYSWRTDLMATRPHWEGWFRGLTDAFLSLRVPRLLILADASRLDPPLLVGQMQGKFQVGLLKAVGHNVQEDAPLKVAELMLRFAGRLPVAAPPSAVSLEP